jgi:hypothetical protein
MIYMVNPVELCGPLCSSDTVLLPTKLIDSLLGVHMCLDHLLINKWAYNVYLLICLLHKVLLGEVKGFTPS